MRICSKKPVLLLTGRKADSGKTNLGEKTSKKSEKGKDKRQLNQQVSSDQQKSKRTS